MLIDPIEKELKKLQEENSRLKILSEVDGLTGLYNRLAGERLINDRLHKNAGGNFMVVDVDGFKKINDQYGHLFGDDVLRGLAALMKEIFGGENLVGRFGGDEFVIFTAVSYTHLCSGRRLLLLRFWEEWRTGLCWRERICMGM